MNWTDCTLLVLIAALFAVLARAVLLEVRTRQERITFTRGRRT